MRIIFHENNFYWVIFISLVIFSILIIKFNTYNKIFLNNLF
jgi:hypothetical protein